MHPYRARNRRRAQWLLPEFSYCLIDTPSSEKRDNTERLNALYTQNPCERLLTGVMKWGS